MNNVLEVKVRYNREKNKQASFYKNLSAKGEVSIEQIDSLIGDLESIIHYYQTVPKYIDGLLIDVHHNTIIPKSKRLQVLLKPDKKSADETIVGARFSEEPDKPENHIITYYVDVQTVQSSIEHLLEAKRFIRERLNGCAKSKNFNEPNVKLSYDGYGNKAKLRSVITECAVIDHFAVPSITASEEKDTLLLTFFQTEKNPRDIMRLLKINPAYFEYSTYGKDTISVPRNIYSTLHANIPYLISMVSSDLSRYTLESKSHSTHIISRSIPHPSNEPTIGVIDNLFDVSVYFSEWVENTDYLEGYELGKPQETDRTHGTEVTSLIVDGPSLNPWLDDGCGRFRVRHFGVCEHSISVPRLITKIKSIIEQNSDIHVWNLSLGTEEEVSRNFISLDGAILDDLQSKYNILFVISGTNSSITDKKSQLRIGSPADSLNSITVNSVKRNGSPASYSRRGPVLSFFNKPDVSYYGGDYEETERINVWSPRGEEQEYGTSFAAPWISRKLAFLIDVIGMPREVAKALIIDAAAGWKYKISTYKKQSVLGYGIVPIRITDILETSNDEIRFVLYGTAETYKTSNYAIPVPKDSDNKYPYVSRATLCYFPACSRSQGVDYTSRELSFKFGRINKSGGIDDINDNTQDEKDAFTDERKARKEFRKWENTKFISKALKNNKPIIDYDERLWGISIISKERLSSSIKKGLNFGIVITLKELYGVNRIQDFIASCALRGWIVNEIRVENRLELYNQNQEELIFD